MIERDFGNGYIVHCDSCSHSEVIESWHWDQLIIEMKAYGWKNLKENGEWIHLCSNCKDSYRGE